MDSMAKAPYEYGDKNVTVILRVLFTTVMVAMVVLCVAQCILSFIGWIYTQLTHHGIRAPEQSDLMDNAKSVGTICMVSRASSSSSYGSIH